MQSLTKSRSALAAWLLGMACLLALAAYRWPGGGWLAIDFQTLLPANSSSHWVSAANKQVADDYAGTLVWLIEGKEPDKVSEFATVVKLQLEASGYADPGYAAVELDRWQELTETLQAHYRGLVRAEDYQLLQRDPKAYFEQNRQLLYSPLGGLSLSLLAKDPSGLFANFLRHITPTRVTTTLESEGIYSELLVINTASDKLGFTDLPRLYEIYQLLQAEALQQHMTLYASGSPLYTAYGVKSASQEMSTIGLASLALLVILLLVSLRSFTAVALTVACIFSGILAGVLATLTVFQQIHVFTLVFGASLIGIAADYALHYLAHSRSKGWTAALALGKVYGALRLSMLSSVIAFSLMLFLPFPGIRQIGLFMASGLICSFLTVCLLFPSLYRGLNNPEPLTGLWVRPQLHWRYSWLLLLALMLAAIVGVIRLPVIDDVRAFYASPPALVTAQDKISALLSRRPDSRYLLLEAPDKRQLLRLEEQLGKELRQLQASDVIADFHGIGSLIPAIGTQMKSAALFASEEFGVHLKEHMLLMGVDDQLQVEVLGSLSQPFAPLDIDILMKHTLPIGIGGFLGCDTTACASRITLAGVNSSIELETLAQHYPDVQFIDQVGTINTTMGVYRGAISYLLFAAAVLITLLFSLIYGWRMAATILAAPVATCLFSLLLVGNWQGGISLINMMALLLLIGVSLDYAIFRAFTAQQEQPATALAISLSAATSILAFGLLGFSDTPVIRSFGQTIAVGLCFAWLFSWIRFSSSEQL